ncbi:DUF3592 domain-containing protein [Streptomyces sp. AC512_CC834]|uniref:DUF3592 domain-containing protein n=1 Tax=Streptomyces sp. AC512_CC834 TaxID=2823691 RepID=UPI001C252174|nr:DUF3592 domain-containing protein [Streptomyces sp. AC512_CC834]
MVRVLKGISKAGASSTHQQNGGLKPRTSVLASLVLALLLGALSVLVMLPAAQHLRSLQDGERARATLHTKGSCMVGHCRVEFEADGRTVVADLPVGSGGGKSSVGSPMIVRYQADDPQVVAREADVGGGGAAVLAVMSGAGALFFLMLSVVAAVFMVRQRRAGLSPEVGAAECHASPAEAHSLER